MSDEHTVQGPEVCISISWLLCPKEWKGRLKRGMKDQLPKAKLGGRASWNGVKTHWRCQWDLPFSKPLGALVDVSFLAQLQIQSIACVLLC